MTVEELSVLLRVYQRDLSDGYVREAILQRLEEGGMLERSIANDLFVSDAGRTLVAKILQVCESASTQKLLEKSIEQAKVRRAAKKLTGGGVRR